MSKPTFRDILPRWLGVAYQWLGLPASIVLALIAVAGLIWWNANDILQRPFVAAAVRRLTQAPLPTRVDGTLNVAVVRLNGDDPNDEKAIFLTRVLRSYSGITVLSVDRAVMDAARARELLSATQADLLLWGNVERLDQRSALALQWMNSEPNPDALANGPYVPDGDSFKMSAMFDEDLARVLRLIVITRLIRSEGYAGRAVPPQFSDDLAAVERLLTDDKIVWDNDTRMRVRWALANGFRMLAEHEIGRDAYKRAQSIYSQLVEEVGAGPNVHDLARIRLAYADALVGDGQRRDDESQIVLAIGHYAAALPVLRAQRNTTDWRKAQADCARAYLAVLGRPRFGRPLSEIDIYCERNASGTRVDVTGTRELPDELKARIDLLQRARDGLSSALRVTAPHRNPVEWAVIQNVVALTFHLERDLFVDSTNYNNYSGEQVTQRNRSLLRRALSLREEALARMPRERLPLAWAGLKLESALTMKELADNQSDEELARAAVAAYRGALEELDPIQTPGMYAIAQLRMAGVHLWLAEEGSTRMADLKAAEDAMSQAYAYYAAVSNEYLANEARMFLEVIRKDIEAESTP
jgi:hypothetical protein